LLPNRNMNYYTHSNFLCKFVLCTSFLLLCLQSVSGQRPFQNCGSPKGKVFNLTLTPCPPGPKCVIKRGENITMQLEFTPNEDSNGLTAVVHGLIGPLPVPFPLPQPDACKSSGITCPVQTGKNYKYYTTLPVLESYPKIRVTVQLELQDDQKKDVSCIQFPLVIQ